MSTWFEIVQSTLPASDFRTQRGETDFYGASDLIAEALGITESPASMASWSHGWRYNPPAFAASYTWSIPEAARVPVLVHRFDEEAFLHSVGVSRAIAVGAPFLYCQVPIVERIPSSLLIVPFHTLDETTQKWDDSEYWRNLDPLLPRFKHVAACIHPSCEAKGLWTNSLEARGIPWFIGANPKDRNALRRIKTLFQSFEHVTSNWIGSHVAYAAVSGCSVSLFGPMPIFRREDYTEQPFYKTYPQILDYDVRLLEEGYVRKTYNFLFRSPDVVADDQAWAAGQLGSSSLRAPEEMGRLLGWSATEVDSEEKFSAWAPSLGWHPPDPELKRLETRIERLKKANQELQREINVLRQANLAQVASRQDKGCGSALSWLRRLVRR